MNEESPVEDETMIVAQASSVSLPLLEGGVPAVLKDSLICHHQRQDGSFDFAVTSGCSVVVSHDSGAVDRRYSVDFTVNQILWAVFPRTKDDKATDGPLECFVVVGDQNIAFFLSDDGHPYNYYVPFRVRRVYQTKFGLFVEQFWRSEEEYRMRHDEHIYVYSLTHPLNELLPVLYRPREFIGRWLFCWEKEEATIVNCFEDCVLVYDRVNGVHRLYQIKRSSDENLKASIFLENELAGVAHSTPKAFGRSSKGHTPASSRVTPKTPFEVPTPAAYPSLSVRTRSMYRLARTRTFPMDSPAFSNFGTPLSNISHDSPAFRLRSSSFQNSFGPNMTRILERDLNNDLFYAEFCLDPIWSDSARREPYGILAEKSFLSYSLTKQVFVNIFLAPANQLRCFRLNDVDGTRTVVGNSHQTICCLDVTQMGSDQTTIVLESENSVALYSGVSRVTIVSFPVPLDRSITQLLPAAGDSFISVLNNDSLLYITLSPLYDDPLVENLFSTMLSAISPQEKAAKLISDWRCYNAAEEIPAWQREPRCPQVLAAFRFILQEIGITIKVHPKIASADMDTRDPDENATSDPKQRRPRQSQPEKWKRLKAFGTTWKRQVPEHHLVELSVDTDAPLFSCSSVIVAAIHSVWQEWYLDTGLSHVRRECVDYLRCCAQVMGNTNLMEAYDEEFPEAVELRYKIASNGELVFAKNPYLDNSFTVTGVFFEILNTRFNGQIYTHSTKLARLFLAAAAGLGIASNAVDIHRMLGKRWGTRIGMATIEVEKIIYNRKMDPAEKRAKLLILFGFNPAWIQALPAVIVVHFGDNVLSHRKAMDMLFPKDVAEDSEFPSLAEVSRVGLLRWPTDIRMENARDMLNSSRPVLINTQKLNQSPNDADQRDVQEVFLSGTCIRYLAQAFGRAMFEFRSLSAYPNANQLVPDLCLSARLFPTNLSYEIPPNDANRPYRDWGEFYNGVASALRLGHSSQVTVDSEWLVSVCCKNDKLSNPTSSGFLFGFALNGHILASTYHVSEMLISLDEFQSIALLLGYAVGKMSSGDLRVYKMLSTQLPFLMGPTTVSISIPSINQTAAMASLGLLFAGNGNTTLVKKLLNEIGKSLPPDEAPATDRFAYRLNAGFSIGLICIGLGNELLKREPPFKQPQPSIIDRLSIMMGGGPREMCVFPMSNGFIPEGMHQTTSQPFSCHVMEAGNVNVHLTAHSACIALGLMFLRTNNEHIAFRLKLPNSIKQLEAIRPDVVMVRTLCQKLVMWDSMDPTEEWVEAAVPPKVMEYLKATLKWHDDEDLVIPANGLEDAYWDKIVDRETISQIYLYCVTGACMALALKYMSSNEQEKSKAHAVIEHFASILLPTSTRPTHRRVVEYAGNNVTSLCLNSLVTSLSLVVAGTGDLKTMRLARLWRINESLLTWMRSIRKHQEQLAAHEAIGMLFMGNARYAFKNDNLSIALLVISFYPVVCHGVTDNKFYHQPLRFLWTQAVEPRLLVPTARKTGRPLDVPVTVYYKAGGAPLRNDGPTMLPPLDTISTVVVGGGEYELIRIDLRDSESGRKDLENLLTRNHGRLRISRTIEIGLSHSGLEDNTPKFSLSSVIDGNMTLYSAEFHPLPSVQKNALSWPALDVVGNVKDHMISLQQILEESASCGKVLPDIRLAHRIAEWGEENALTWALELEMDKLQIRDPVPCAPSHVY